MTEATTKEIIAMMEGLREGQSLSFKLSPTFGGQFAVIELNPLYPAKGEKRYVLRVGKTEEAAREGKPFWAADKAKKLAGWVGERSAVLTTAAPPLQKTGS